MKPRSLNSSNQQEMASCSDYEQESPSLYGRGENQVLGTCKPGLSKIMIILQQEGQEQLYCCCRRYLKRMMEQLVNFVIRPPRQNTLSWQKPFLFQSCHVPEVTSHLHFLDLSKQSISKQFFREKCHITGLNFLIQESSAVRTEVRNVLEKTQQHQVRWFILPHSICFFGKNPFVTEAFSAVSCQ